MTQLRNLNSCLLGLSLTAGLFVAQLSAQTTLQAPTFGTVINLGYTPSDVVLDESRGQLYLVNSNGNKVDVVRTASNKLVRSIYVGTLPLAAAMSPDNSTLYVTNSGVSTVTARISGAVSSGPLTNSTCRIVSRRSGRTVRYRTCFPRSPNANCDPGTSTRRM